MMRTRRYVLMSGLLTLLAFSQTGCGDGSGNGSDGAQPPAPPTQPSSPTNPTNPTTPTNPTNPTNPTTPATPSSGATACDTATGPKRFVGQGQTYSTIRQAAAAALSGDVIVISAGDYVGDVATWPQDNLTICGAGGRARLFANGVNAGGKAIWVVQGRNVVIDSVEFHDASVDDHNGAGIRAEGNGLTVINAGFYDNEEGILGPNAGDITIIQSEFARNGYGDGYSHNLYVGTANKLTVLSSFFHEAKIGHNLKSRARETDIEDSYFMDGPSGTSSYLIDVPNGGQVYLRGNLLQKGPNAENNVSVSYGAEGLTGGQTNTLEMVYNTLVSTRPGGSFVRGAAGMASLTLTANLFAGTGSATRWTGVDSSIVSEVDTRETTADQITAPTNIQAPNFWPLNPAFFLLGNNPDPTYTTDAPAPYVTRDITGQARYAGALQSAP